MAVSLTIALVIVAGQWAQRYLDQNQRRDVRFLELDCPIPTGYERERFLNEVRQIGDLPETIELPNEDLTNRLAWALARHPLVESVGLIEANARVGVRIELTYREPMLAVETLGRPGSSVYLIDREGVRLPPPSTAPRLMRFPAPVAAPTVGIGEKWEDATIQAALRLAIIIAPEQESLRIRTIEVTPQGWRLTPESGRPAVLWGRAPGDERADEPSAWKKLQRLRESLPFRDGPRIAEIDLRR